MENADDMRLNYVLFKKCTRDKQKFCSEVKYGNARVKECLEVRAAGAAAAARPRTPCACIFPLCAPLPSPSPHGYALLQRCPAACPRTCRLAQLRACLLSALPLPRRLRGAPRCWLAAALIPCAPPSSARAAR